MNENFDLPFWYLHFWQLLSDLNEAICIDSITRERSYIYGYLSGLYCSRIIDYKQKNSLIELCGAAFNFAYIQLAKSLI